LILVKIINIFDSIKFNNIIIANDETRIIDLIIKISNNFPSVKFDVIDSEDGQTKKTCSSLIFNDIFGQFEFTDIHQGLVETIKWFIQNYEIARK
jgi:GDP-L-fucose synthase